MHQRFAAYMLKPFGQIKRSEVLIVSLMFLYSFLLMAACAVIKPATKSKFIEGLGPDNMPYVQLVAGAIIGLVMTSYSWLVSRIPGRLRLIISQAFIAVVLIVFWFLFRTGAAHPTLHYFQAWVSAAFYLFGLILALLMLSQFWALANIVFDPRQAKRLFGFIGGGSSLGGILGSCLASYRIVTDNLLLISAGFIVLSIVAVGMIIRQQGISEEMQDTVANAEKGISGKEAVRMFRKSKHLRWIALVISFAAIGACIIDQQLNMAAAEIKGRQETDAITVFLAHVQLWTSVIGFLVQIFLTSRIHQRLGIGFALLLLPVSLGSSAIIILLNAALWAPSLARILDQSLRYTIDKTSREVLYMPLPSEVKFAAKQFIDVTVDRLARSLGAVLLLFLIKPWGLALGWQKLSCASIVITGVWIWMALRARRGYREALRESINTREMKPAEVTAAAADLPTIESLIQELASPDEQRVLYAIDFLESFNKNHLITPLLLFHESPAVRARALSVMRVVQPEISARWLHAIQAMMTDPDSNVRSEAVAALASMHNQEASDMVRLLLQDKNPRISLTAAMMLAGSGEEQDVARAEDVIDGLVSDTRESAAPVRRDFAIAIRQAPIPHFRRLLIPLLNDPDPEVAEEAMRSTRRLGATDFIFIPTMISLLRNRRQKSNARELLVGFGERAIPILCHFLRDPDEDLWIRRHIPGTIARIPCQKAMDILVDALDEKDGFLRFHVIAALERIHRIEAELSFNRSRIESLILEESAFCTPRRRLHRILLQSQSGYRESLLARAIVEKIKRGVDRIYRLLSLLYPWKVIAAARHTIENGDARSRAGTLEYLDNLLAGGLRKTLIPLLEEALPWEDSMSFAGTSFGAEASILSLIDDEDPMVASAAIYFVSQQRLLNLVDGIERVLEKRDARDRLVLETASWALQELRAPAPKRRLIWLDPLPSVDMANQMSNLSLFGSVTVDEIFRICAMGRQVRSEPGRIIFQEALVPENVQFLLSGRVAVMRPDGETRQIESPAVLAFQEVLEERPMAESVRAADMTVCLTLTSEEIQALLADNSNLVPGLFQMLCRDFHAGRAVVKGSQSPYTVLPANRNFNAIEKGLVLKTIPVFSQVSPDEIIALASIAAEMQLTSGSDLFTEADQPSIYVLISGEVSIEGHVESPIIAGPSDVIGIYETLAGIDFKFLAHIRQDGIALRIAHEDLFDLLVQRSTLLRQVLGALFRK